MTFPLVIPTRVLHHSGGRPAENSLLFSHTEKHNSIISCTLPPEVEVCEGKVRASTSRHMKTEKGEHVQHKLSKMSGHHEPLEDLAPLELHLRDELNSSKRWNKHISAVKHIRLNLYRGNALTSLWLEEPVSPATLSPESCCWAPCCRHTDRWIDVVVLGRLHVAYFKAREDARANVTSADPRVRGSRSGCPGGIHASAQIQDMWLRCLDYLYVCAYEWFSSFHAHVHDPLQSLRCYSHLFIQFVTCIYLSCNTETSHFVKCNWG